MWWGAEVKSSFPGGLLWRGVVVFQEDYLRVGVKSSFPGGVYFGEGGRGVKSSFQRELTTVI